MERVWVPHPEQVWVPGLLKSGTTYGTEVGDVTLKPADAKGLITVHDDQLSGVDNICNLSEVNEGAVLYTVKARYLRQEIYTRVTKILIATNPFQPVPIFGAKFVDLYKGTSDSMQEAPHVFGIGSDVIAGMRNSASSQAVLVSGESGAGKTETAKLILSFMSEAVSSEVHGMQDRILATNPVLESYGNSMTVRNNNSSRFGKWLEISMSESLQIQGGSVTDYLLELTRVNHQGKDERNYHIFFQLMACRDDDLLKDLGIQDASKYRYTNSCKAIAPGIDDKEFFNDLKSAFTCLGLSVDLQKEIFRVTFSLLTLGNADFIEKGDATAFSNEPVVARAAELLGMDSKALQRCLLTRRICVGTEVTVSPLTVQQANAARDAFVRLIYGRLFKWMCGRINKVLSPGDPAKVGKGRWFGVLDIAGFECFALNSLEQLFINLGNEKLQAHFNTYVFDNELKEYKAEGIEVLDIKYQDNSDILSLIEAKGGILTILDEEITVPKATDLTFVSKVVKALASNKRLVVPKMGGKPIFGVNHFAGTVTYTCDGFLEKNIDKPPDESMDLLASSSMTVIKEMLQRLNDEEKEAEKTDGGARKAPGTKKGKRTVSVSFKASLAALMLKLKASDPHFIRCIKPNSEKVPNKFTHKNSLEQLLFSGVMEAVKIRQAGYSSRTTYMEFFGRYKLLVPKAQRTKLAQLKSDQDKTKELVKLLPKVLNDDISPKDLVFGTTKVFMKSGLNRKLEGLRPMIVAASCIIIQKMYKGYLVRKKMKMAKQLAVWLTAYKKNGNASVLKIYGGADGVRKELEKLAGLIDSVEQTAGRLPIVDQCSKVRDRMNAELKMTAEFKELLTCNDSTTIDTALAKAANLGLTSGPDVEALKKRSEKLEVQFPLKCAIEDALEKGDLEQLKECYAMIEKYNLGKCPDNWVKGLECEQLAGQVYDKIGRVAADDKMNHIRAEQQDAAKEKVFGATPSQAHFEEDTKPKTRKTITGMADTEVQQLLLQLQFAAGEYDVGVMDKLLRTCAKNGVDKDNLKSYKDLLAQFQQEEWLNATIMEVQEDVKSEECTETCIKQLQNLAAQLFKIAGDELFMQDAQELIQAAMKRRARANAGASAFDGVEDDADDDDCAMAIDAYDLEHFPHLKKTFKGHGGLGFFRRVGGQSGRGNIHVMCSHTTDGLKEAMTQVPANLEGMAVHCFRDILGWMNDLTAETRRLSFRQDLIIAAKSSVAMCDEVYCQLMKQLTMNPSTISTLHGWKLLLMICQEACPSTDLQEFVRAFLAKSIRSLRHEPTLTELLVLARQAFTDFNRQVIETQMDFESAGGGPQGKKDVVVSLIDQSTRKVRVKENATLIEVGDALATTIRLHRIQDFRFFQLVESDEKNSEVHRLLPMQASLKSIVAKMQALESKSKRRSHLLLKRVFMDQQETLKAGDMTHANLTYRQALYDFLHYPIWEEKELVMEISASMLAAERDLLAEAVQKRDLSKKDELEKAMPEQMLKFEKDRKAWSTRILRQLDELEADRDPGEMRVQSMSRVLARCQKMRLFGSMHWFAEQMKHVPDEGRGLDNLPMQMMPINKQTPEAEYWINVTRSGVSFVPFDSGPGEDFCRKFQFDSEAMSRVVRWGFKGPFFQLVVSACDPEHPSAGVVEWTISCGSPSAPDICFGIQSSKGNQK